MKGKKDWATKIGTGLGNSNLETGPGCTNIYVNGLMYEPYGLVYCNPLKRTF